MKNTLNLFLVALTIFLSSCAGSSKSSSTTPTLVSVLAGGTWNLTKATSGGTDVKSTFLVQKLVLNADNTVTVTTYPSGTSGGNWSADANSVTVSTTTGTTLSLSYTSASVSGAAASGTILTASIQIAQGTGGKTAAATVAVEYTRQ